MGVTSEVITTFISWLVGPIIIFSEPLDGSSSGEICWHIYVFITDKIGYWDQWHSCSTDHQEAHYQDWVDHTCMW